jgi:hypothetical protein
MEISLDLHTLFVRIERCSFVKLLLSYGWTFSFMTVHFNRLLWLVFGRDLSNLGRDWLVRSRNQVNGFFVRLGSFVLEGFANVPYLRHLWMYPWKRSWRNKWITRLKMLSNLRWWEELDVPYWLLLSSMTPTQHGKDGKLRAELSCEARQTIQKGMHQGHGCLRPLRFNIRQFSVR